MYGLPRQLTYDTYVMLTLCLSRAEARKARPGVFAQEITTGRTGPVEYYRLDVSDDKEGDRLYEEALCRNALNRSK